MEVRHITHASEAELDRMADILMDAFGDDAILLRCSGNSHNNLRRAMRMRAEKTIPHGGVWTAVEGGKVVGLMICDLPGQDSPEAVSVSMSKATDADPIPDEIKEWIATSVRPPIHQLELESFGPDGEKKSMYVHFLAVDPAGRGKGIGKLLLKEAFKIADESGVRTTLLNPKELNLTIYGRLGFIKAGHVQIEAPDASHTLWTMYREPASS